MSVLTPWFLASPRVSDQTPVGTTVPLVTRPLRSHITFPYSFILFVRSESLSLAYTQGERNWPPSLKRRI